MFSLTVREQHEHLNELNAPFPAREHAIIARGDLVILGRKNPYM